ncbi:MAG: aldolase [Clostridia bacterium]|nr:aldolase [Clostridia bacterium]
MSLTLMYITNKPEIAKVAQIAGVDRIWVDMEYIGKEIRQHGMDTVKSHHTLEDVHNIRKVVTSSELMVRINPIHDETSYYSNSENEIEDTIQAGADVLMLPMFKTPKEVQRFVDCVNGRSKTMLLFETMDSVNNIDEILQIDGIDEVHIGLNDLHLDYKKKFMFELLCDGTVDYMCDVFKRYNKKFGFGGIARVGFGMLPAEYIITHHYYLGSTAAILSRGFCDANKIDNPEIVRDLFIEGVSNIRKKEDEVSNYTLRQYKDNYEIIKEIVYKIANG